MFLHNKMEIASDAQACFIVPCPPVRSPLLGSRAAPHGDMGMVWYGMVWYGTQAHMVTGTQAQRATLLCPQPVVPCRLSIHRAVCPWVSCRLRRSHVGCPHNGMSVDPSWTPQVACISVHTTALTSHFPAWSIHRPGPDSHFPHNQDLIPRLSGPRPLAGSAPLCPPDY